MLPVPAAFPRLRPAGGAALAVCAAVGIAVWFVYAPRRVECAEHGVVVEHIPWSDGKRPLTRAMMGFLARWALSSAAVEGLNNKVRVITRRSYGFRTYNGIEVALYHTLGRLPEPETAHRFC